jgi:hypothetical protein
MATFACRDFQVPSDDPQWLCAELQWHETWPVAQHAVNMFSTTELSSRPGLTLFVVN